MSRLELPDGAWAELASPRKVSDRKRARYRRAMFAFNASTADLPRDPDNPAMPDSRYFGDEHSGLADNIDYQLILCLVREWSFGDVNADVLADEMPGDAKDELSRACIKLAPDLMPDFSPDPDPKVFTGASPGSPTASSTEEPTYVMTSFDGMS